MRIVFHRDGSVSVDGEQVGRFRSPDPSGAPHARALMWVFNAWDGRASNARSRRLLEPDAVAALHRKRRNENVG